MAEEEDITIPRTALNKMMKEILPHIRVASDSRELILNCCTEFVHLISSEANEICNKQAKKTIAPEHVLDALDSLGFGDYLNDCKSTLEQCKTVAAKKRRGSNRLENLGIPEEELLRQQQELFEKARLEQAAIEQQEWLQVQSAQMQQEGTEQPPAGHPGVAGPTVQGASQSGAPPPPSQFLHQPWVDQKPPVGNQLGSAGASQAVPPGAGEPVSASPSIKKEELGMADTPGSSNTGPSQSSSMMSETQGRSTVIIKTEPSD